MDQHYATITRQFLRALRGPRSQVAHSRRLGFSSNVAAEWESGRRTPTASGLLTMCRRLRINVKHAFARGSITAITVQPRDAQGIAHWLDALRAGTPITVVAERARLSRHQVARFLNGQSEPRLHQFFALIDSCSGRLPEFVAALVDIECVPFLHDEFQRLSALRSLAFRYPAASAIVAALEVCPDLQPSTAAADLAAALELDEREVSESLAALQRGGVVNIDEHGVRPGSPLLVDTSANREGARALRRYWAEVGARRSAHPRSNDLFSYNVFSVSRDDLCQIRELQTEYYQRVRAIVQSSRPEVAALLNLQLVEWDVPRQKT